MISAPGMVAWAINGAGFEKDAKKLVNVIASGWGVPAAAAKVRRLDPDGDIEDPSGQDPDAFFSLGIRLQNLVRGRVAEMLLST